jgi:ribonuclease Y
MNALAFIILASLAGLGVGAALTGFFLKSKHAKQEDETKDRIKSMLREAELTAETIKKDRMLEAKERFLKLKAEFDEETNNKKNLIITISPAFIKTIRDEPAGRHRGRANPEEPA